MSEQKQPRRVNTRGAQHKRTTAAGGMASGPAARQAGNAGASGSGQPPRNAGRATSVRVAARRQAAAAAKAPKAPPPAAKAASKRRVNPVLVALAAILLIIFVAWQLVMGAIAPEKGTSGLQELMNSIGPPDEYSGDVINILVCGIDSDAGETRSYGAGENDGMTDMVMYVNFDTKTKKASLLQIPRNTFVGGTITTANNTYKASNGQINSVVLSNGGSVTALADVIHHQFGLPVDNYITINMAALKEVVDVFGGVEVYVPHDMEYKGSKLPQGYQTLTGEAAEFFVRCRHGEGYARADLDRLNMQRYFYSGLLGKIRTMTLKDAVRLTPAFMNYVTTDLDTVTIGKLAVSLLKTDSANIMLCQLPVYGGGEYYNGVHSVVVTAPNESAALLNQYFRDYTGPVEVGQMNLPYWSVSGTPSDPNVQFMGQLDTEREQGQQNENIDGSYSVTAENTAVQGG